jgi:glutaminyl-peptide cyclotransferase
MMALAVLVGGGVACRQEPVAAEPPVAVVAPATGQDTRLSRLIDPTGLARMFQELARLSPRPPESENLRECRQYIERTLRDDGLTVRTDHFRALTPAGPLSMANVIGEKAGSTGRIIYLATHIDTKRIPGIRFLGANDSGSSTAAVLELARVLGKSDTRHTYRFLFLDGEEALGENITVTDGLYGSRFQARRLEQSQESGRVRAFILLDMIGDRDLQLVDDQTSSEELRGLLAECCRKLGEDSILGGGSNTMVDDHVPFRELGIPVIDLIDFDYGPGNGFWHTDKDTPENVSMKSITRVTRVVLCMLDYLEAE